MKKSSLLLQRPVRTFDDDPEPVNHQIQPESEIPKAIMSVNPVEAEPGKIHSLTTGPSASGEIEASTKFGPLTVDLAKAKKREPKGLLTTTVPSILHSRLMQQEEGPSGFINNAVEKHLRTHLNEAVEAGYRLAALRVAQAEDSRTISARARMTYVVDVDEAVRYVTQSLEKVSAAFIVGGCVMLSAEEQGLV